MNLKRHYQSSFKKPSKWPVIFLIGGFVGITAIAFGLFYKAFTSAVRVDIASQPTLQSGANGPVIPQQADLGHSYGIAAGGSLPGKSDEDIDAYMASVADSGAKWVRFDFNWALIQPDAADAYNWERTDAIVEAAQRHGLYVLGIIDYTPGWARSSVCPESDKCEPAKSKQFATFARAVSHRYKEKGLHYWEIWNEPNNPQFWQPRSNPQRYAELLKDASKELRAEDKDAYIITAGLSPQATTENSYAPADFLRAVYGAGVKDSFDAVADHPYTFPITPKNQVEHAWNQMASLSYGLRQIMVNNGDAGKKIWITEFGSPTGGPGAISTIENPNLDAHPYVVDEALQAKILSDAADLYASYEWAGPFMYYSYQDSGTTQDTNENFFGLVRFDGSKKPAYQTFKDAATSSATK